MPAGCLQYVGIFERAFVEPETRMPAGERHREGIEIVVGDMVSGRHQFEHRPPVAHRPALCPEPLPLERQQHLLGHPAAAIEEPLAEQRVGRRPLDGLRPHSPEPRARADDLAGRRQQHRRPVHAGERGLEMMRAIQPANEVRDDRLDALALAAGKPHGFAELPEPCRERASAMQRRAATPRSRQEAAVPDGASNAQRRRTEQRNGRRDRRCRGDPDKTEIQR
jgi:hypothetical protein